jgi:hypothetical protein
MVKNITLSLSQDLADQMDALPEVNWSQVARTCIQHYLTQRRNPDLTPLLNQLRKEKGDDYMSGRRQAEAIAHTLGYTQLNLLLKAYRKKTHNYKPHTTQRLHNDTRTFIPTPNDLMEDLLRKKHLITDASHAYIQGLRERLFEIATALEQLP